MATAIIRWVREEEMILYHYTSKAYLPLIEIGGLEVGEVPLTPTKLRNAVWLTTDSNPDGHGLDGSCLNKRAVRITVRIPTHDRKLKHWPAWGRKRLARWWYAALDEAGGGKSESWYLYFGTIPPSAFLAVEDSSH
jgi:hypothetical protein